MTDGHQCVTEKMRIDRHQDKDKKCVRFALSATIIQVVRSSFFDQFLLAISADRARIMEPCILFS